MVLGLQPFATTIADANNCGCDGSQREMIVSGETNHASWTGSHDISNERHGCSCKQALMSQKNHALDLQWVVFTSQHKGLGACHGVA